MSTISASTTSTTAYKVTADTTGTLVLQTGSTPTTAVTIDTAQNMGLGVTPSAWGSGYVAFENKSGALYAPNTSQVTLIQNAYYNGSNFIYRYSSQNASRYQQNNGEHTWHVSGAGTAGGTITFTQAMTLDANGNLLVNTTTAREKITVNGSIAASGQLIPYSGSTSLGYIGNDSSISGGSGSNIGLRSEAAMLFATGGSTERARIDSSGNLLVGTTTSTAKLNIVGVGGSFNQSLYISGWGSGIGGAATWKAANTSNADVMYFETSAAQVGKIAITSTATSYVTSSDYRLKENVQPMAGALAKVVALKPCTYTWKSNGEAGEGFIAHELAEVVPQAVTGEKDEVKEDGTPVYQGIDTSFLVATLTAALQEQQAIIETLTNRITALENK